MGLGTGRTGLSGPSTPLPYPTLAALNAAVPSPVVGQAYPYVTGYLVWTSTGWLGDIGVVATLAEAQALTGIADGSTCTVSGDGIVYVAKAA